MREFLLGFTIGAAIGAVVVIATAPQSGADARSGVVARVQGALAAAREAAQRTERDLWADYHQRIGQRT